MSQRRLSMRKIRELMRLKYELGRSHREIATSLGIANSTVSDYVRRASAAGFSWPLPEGLDDAALEAALFPAPPPSRVPRPEPDWGHVHRELQRHKGVTLQLLWLEYRAVHPNGYQYSWFCERYRAWREQLDVVMRQVYRAGEKAFVDYAGPKFPVVDRSTGEVRDAMVFVGVLGASNHTFVDVTWSRSLPDWTMSHVWMFEFWGGVPELVIPDNEKAAVREASRYEPDLNPTYQELATHYGTTVLPARPCAPRDKAKVEAAVQHVERWIHGAAAQPDVLLARRTPRGHRTAAGRTERATVPEDRRQPPRLVRGSGPAGAQAAPGPALRVRRVAQGPCQHRLSHPGRTRPLQRPPRAGPQRGRCSDHGPDRGDLPQAPPGRRAPPDPRERRIRDRTRAHAGSPPRPCGMDTVAAHRLGPQGRTAHGSVRRTAPRLESRPHPEQGYRSCLGLMKLLRAYSAERLEAACRRALDIGTLSYGSVKSILATGLDQAGDDGQRTLSLPAEHAHIRGPEYYTNSPNGKES